MSEEIEAMPANTLHEEFKNELAELLEKHREGLSDVEMLAIASQVVGVLLTMQDPTKITAAQAMRMINVNILEANTMCFKQLQGKPH